jgi:hypothetical protein
MWFKPSLVAILICLLASTALVVNQLLNQFHGNNYFPPGSPLVGLSLLLILAGISLLFDKDHDLFKMSWTLFLFFLVMTVIAFATNALQFTPFEPIDNQLIAADASLGIHLDQIVEWTNSKPFFMTVLSKIYDSLPYQMCYLPLILILARKYSLLEEYYALLLISTLLGFTFYYFWPTIDPASSFKSAYFSPLQYATGIKFAEIHKQLSPTTIEGGMIAMPSYHVIWALLCLHLLRCWPLIFTIFLPINLLLVASCVLLGWHYFIDLLGSCVVLLLSYFIYTRGRPKC